MREDLTKIIQNGQTYLLVKEVAKEFKCTATTLKKNLIKQSINVHNLENFGRTAFVLQEDLEHFTYKHRELEIEQIETFTEPVEALKTLEDTIEEIKIKTGITIKNKLDERYCDKYTDREELLSSLFQANLISFGDYKAIIFKEKMRLPIYATKKLTLDYLEDKTIWSYRFQEKNWDENKNYFGVLNKPYFAYSNVNKVEKALFDKEELEDYLVSYKVKTGDIEIVMTGDENGESTLCIYKNKELQAYYILENLKIEMLEGLCNYTNLDFTIIEKLYTELTSNWKYYLEREAVRNAKRQESEEKARKEKQRKEEEDSERQANYWDETFRNYYTSNLNTSTNFDDEEKKMLKQMYKKMAIELHPDRNREKDTTKQMQILNGLKTKLEI